MTSHPEPADSARRPARAFGWVRAALGCALAGAAVFQFFGNANRGYIDTASLFYWWSYQWTNPSSEMEHGWLIVAVSAWLLWRNLRQAENSGLQAESLAPRSLALGSQLSTLRSLWPSTAAMTAGLALHAVGFVAQQARISIVAFLIFTWGVLRLAGGRRWGGAAAFPLGFLAFAIPVNVLDSVGFWLQMGVIRAAAAIAHAAGIEVLRSGTQLVSPDGSYHYDVVAACSGVRSLVAMLSLSLLMGYLSFRGWGRRAVVVLLCIPLVYVGNVARIATIVFAAEGGGQKWGDIAHTVMGWGVFGIVLGGVVGAIRLMERRWPEGEARKGGRRTKDETENWKESRVSAPALVAVSVVALAIGEMSFLHHLKNLPPRGGAGVVLAADQINPVELPAFLGTEWIGRRTEITAIEREILPPDTGFSRKVYVSVAAPAKPVLLSLVLSGRDRTSIHRPELCLVGQGWTIAGAAEERFRFPGAASETGASFPATLLRVRREISSAATPGPRRAPVVVPQLVAYWFVNADAVVASHWQRLARDMWNRVVHGRADRWAYVLMQTDASDGESAALARMQTVLNGTLPAFQKPFVN